jgi:hypothetical protein
MAVNPHIRQFVTCPLPGSPFLPFYKCSGSDDWKLITGELCALFTDQPYAERQTYMNKVMSPFFTSFFPSLKYDDDLPRFLFSTQYRPKYYTLLCEPTEVVTSTQLADFLERHFYDIFSKDGCTEDDLSMWIDWLRDMDNPNNMKRSYNFEIEQKCTEFKKMAKSMVKTLVEFSTDGDLECGKLKKALLTERKRSKRFEQERIDAQTTLQQKVAEIETMKRERSESKDQTQKIATLEKTLEIERKKRKIADEQKDKMEDNVATMQEALDAQMKDTQDFEKLKEEHIALKAKLQRIKALF